MLGRIEHTGETARELPATEKPLGLNRGERARNRAFGPVSDFPAVAEVGHPHQPSAVEFALGCEWPAVYAKKADGHRKRF
jgi:hypothetical protein